MYVAASGTIYPDQLYTINADNYHRDITATIERIVNLKRTTFVGGMFDSDDLAQEIRIRLIRATMSIKSGKSIFLFLVRCADNLILDLWRGIYRANNPPCKICASGKSCQPDGQICNKAREYNAVLKIRQNIDRPEPLGDIDILHFDTVLEDMYLQELHKKIIKVLSPKLLKSYHNLINSSGEGVPVQHKRRIREIVRGIINGEKA